MPVKKFRPLIFIFNILIFSAVLLFDTADFIDISIKNATPLLTLPLLCGFAIFASVSHSAAVGFIIGAVLDSTASDSYCFNTICFLLLGVFVCLSSNNLFNKNIRASTALAVIISVIYFTARWLCFMAFGVGMQNSLLYLLSYALPSAIYSAVFVFPFFYIFRHWSKPKTR